MKAVTVSSEPLATMEQYRISFNRNTTVFNEQFIREGHTTFNSMNSDIQTQLSRRMQEGHLRSKTLIWMCDVTAKIETRNFGNKNIYYGTSR